MDDPDRPLTLSVRADFGEFHRGVEEATRVADGLGRALTRAFDGAILRGNAFSDVLRQLALRLSRLALDAAMRPLEAGISSAIGGGLGSLLPFAKGGVVNGPVMFPLGGGRTGLAGEAGAEAILPLRRGADGRLGVAAGGQGGAVKIHFNVTTPDARSFLAAESQVHAMLARAAERGRRNL
jgi:phage-related minor tail protein